MYEWDSLSVSMRALVYACVFPLEKVVLHLHLEREKYSKKKTRIFKDLYKHLSDRKCPSVANLYICTVTYASS